MALFKFIVNTSIYSEKESQQTQYTQDCDNRDAIGELVDPDRIMRLISKGKESRYLWVRKNWAMTAAQDVATAVNGIISRNI